MSENLYPLRCGDYNHHLLLEVPCVHIMQHLSEVPCIIRSTLTPDATVRLSENGVQYNEALVPVLEREIKMEMEADSHARSLSTCNVQHATRNTQPATRTYTYV